MGDFWTGIGEAGHIAIYLGLLSALGVIFDALGKKGGVLGTIGKAVKAIIDFFSGNLQHVPKK